jgi:hypothetical protein
MKLRYWELMLATRHKRHHGNRNEIEPGELPLKIVYKIHVSMGKSSTNGGFSSHV